MLPPVTVLNSARALPAFWGTPPCSSVYGLDPPAQTPSPASLCPQPTQHPAPGSPSATSVLLPSPRAPLDAGSVGDRGVRDQNLGQGPSPRAWWWIFSPPGVTPRVTRHKHRRELSLGSVPAGASRVARTGLGCGGGLSRGPWECRWQLSRLPLSWREQIPAMPAPPGNVARLGNGFKCSWGKGLSHA